ncbi:MAG: glycosyltransferase family 39 protein [Chloroflexi bacterium]|nr:glycosyltransferase family 39 protein [Chloroflexota bacterium]
MNGNRFALVWAAGCALLIALRFWLPERSIHALGLRAAWDSLFALLLAAVVLLLGYALGKMAWGWFHLASLSRLESGLFQIALGLGGIALGVMVLGFAGWLTPAGILGWLALVGLFTWEVCGDTLPALPRTMRKLGERWKRASLGQRAAAGAALILFLLFLAQALTPPTDPDGLIDHLRVPKLFLEAGRFYPTPEFVFANYPLLIESLFTVGMAFGSDTFAKVLHLAYAGLLTGAVFALGRRLISPLGGWLSAAVLLSMPIFPVWASLAYIDMAWAFYEFMGVYAFLLWLKRRREGWLALAGVMFGLALGSKYLAFGGLAMTSAGLLWALRKAGWRVTARGAAIIGGIALALAAPWLIKNWLWLGNPVYPFFSGGVSETLRTWEGFRWWDYFLLPWYLYADRLRFAGVYGSIEMPSLLFPLALLYPFTRRKRSLTWLAGLTLLRFAVWALITHIRLRYMLPVFPMLSVVAAAVLVHLLSLPRGRLFWRVAVFGVTGGVVAATMTYGALFFLSTRPAGVIVGTESRDAYLRRQLGDYPALRAIQEELPVESRTAMFFDPRGYYCDQRCLPDYHLRRVLEITRGGMNLPAVTAALGGMGATHILFDLQGADYKLQLAGTDEMRAAVKFLTDEYLPACARELRRDEWVRLYEITCE